MWAAAEPATRHGYEVLGCAGPDQRLVGECPMRHGASCPLAAAADAIVVAVPPDSERARWLLAAHGRLHPDVPLLVVGGPDDLEVPAGGCRLAAGTPAAQVIDRLDALARRRPDDAP